MAEKKDHALTFDEARALPAEKRKKGLRVKGSEAPFGGSWVHEGGELVLTEPPTNLEPPQPSAAKKEEK